VRDGENSHVGRGQEEKRGELNKKRASMRSLKEGGTLDGQHGKKPGLLEEETEQEKKGAYT